MKFKYNDYAKVTGDPFFNGTEGRVVNFQETTPKKDENGKDTDQLNVRYLITFDTHSCWFSEEKLELVPVNVMPDRFFESAPDFATYATPAD